MFLGYELLSTYQCIHRESDLHGPNQINGCIQDGWVVHDLGVLLCIRNYFRSSLLVYFSNGKIEQLYASV